jgi:hypothetical protein
MVFLSLSSEAHVTLDAFSLNGRHVATLLSERLPAGSYNRSLNVSGLSRGLYVYRLKAGNLVDTRKVMLGR